MYSVTLPKSVSDEVSEGTSEVVEVRTLSTTKNDYDDNHWEKLCTFESVPEIKHDPFKSEIGKFVVC